MEKSVASGLDSQIICESSPDVTLDMIPVHYFNVQEPCRMSRVFYKIELSTHFKF